METMVKRHLIEAADRTMVDALIFDCE